MRISKYYSAGSDQVVVRAPAAEMFTRDTAAIARALLDRWTAFGADGLVILNEDAPSTPLAVTPDGKKPSLCINGTLAAAHDSFDWLGRQNLDFEISGGRYSCRETTAIAPNIKRISFGEVSARVVPASSIFLIDEPNLYWQCRKVFPEISGLVTVDIGTPQLYLFGTVFSESRLEEFGRILNSPTISSDGVNITLVRPTSSGLVVRTFERGGAGLTNSCASASAGSVLALMEYDHSRARSTTTVFTKGGRLDVSATSNTGAQTQFRIESMTFCSFWFTCANLRNPLDRLELEGGAAHFRAISEARELIKADMDFFLSHLV